MTDRADEGGEPACWAHLVDDDGFIVADLTHPFGVASPTAAGSGSSGRQACGGEVTVDAKACCALVDNEGAEVS